MATDLTRSMRVSAVVIFLLLDRSDFSVRCSWPPPGLSDHQADDDEAFDDDDGNYDHRIQENLWQW